MYKERVESMLEENRKLVTETAVLNKSVENYKQLQEALEKKVSKRCTGRSRWQVL